MSAGTWPGGEAEAALLRQIPVILKKEKSYPPAFCKFPKFSLRSIF